MPNVIFKNDKKFLALHHLDTTRTQHTPKHDANEVQPLPQNLRSDRHRIRQYYGYLDGNRRHLRPKTANTEARLPRQGR